MITLALVTFVDLFVTVFNVILIMRVLMSYFAGPGNRFFGGLVNLTEPVLAPIRRAIPATPGIDFAPLVAFFVLQAVQLGVHWLASNL